MGCFLSSPKIDQNGLKNQHLHLRSHAPKSNATQEAKCRSPPPPPPPVVVEEESVKEVLLQTPISKPQVPILKPETKTQSPIMQTRKDPNINKALEEASEEVSLISETCSVGESFSTITTATVPETTEDEVTSKRSTREGTRNRNRTHSDASRKRSYTDEGNRNGGRKQRPKSPAWRPENPPEKKVLMGSRSVRRREFSDRVRRDYCGGSNRRSRSPSCVRTVGDGSGQSQLRPPGGVGRRLPPPAKDESDEVVGKTNDSVWMEESLENPHVSLECFIFL